jgi:hypothetical protein
MNDDNAIDTLRIVSAADPAIDDERTDRREYARTRDARMLHFLPGQHPALGWYVLRPLTTNDVVACDMSPSPESKFVSALVYGLARVEFPATNDTLEPTKEIAGRPNIWAQKDVDVLLREVGREVLYEIGVVIYQRSARGKRQAGGAGYWPLPGPLLEGLEQIELQRAEQKRKDASGNNG